MVWTLELDDACRAPLDGLGPHARTGKHEHDRLMYDAIVAAAVVIGSLKIWPHFENTRFEVIITLLRS
jgi:hypothetical protein